MKIPTALERRKSRRFNVEWLGTLECLFPNFQERIHIKISEVSETGARIQAESLKVGPYNIIAQSDLADYILNINLTAGVYSTPVKIAWWCSHDEQLQHFDLGVLFLKEVDAVLKAFLRMKEADTESNVPLV
jgi:hypothetical protein